MERNSERWREVNPSQFPWEREGLDFLRRALPDVQPIRAWANVEFVAQDGSINEIDALILTSAGLFLVELKAWSGRITGDGQQWSRITAGATRPLQVDNPILATNRKAKKLASLLRGQDALRQKRVHIEELVFLSNPKAECKFTSTGRSRIFGRGPGTQGGSSGRGGADALSSITDVLLGRQPVVDQNPIGQIDNITAAAIGKAVEQCGIRPCQAERRAGDYILKSKIGEADGLWEDWIGEHTMLKSKRRIRRWLSGLATDTDSVTRLANAAKREFRFHAALEHPAIDKPLDLRETEYGPVLIYDFNEHARPLTAWLAEQNERLSLLDRIGLIRQLAELLEHAHGRRLYHRALAASVIEVLPGTTDPKIGEIESPQLRVRDWATGAREAEGLAGSSGDMSLTGTMHLAELVSDPSRAYLAPETFTGDPRLDPVALDVFALGAVAFLILTGRPPAANAAELRILLQQQGALDLGQVQDGVAEQLRDVVRDATAANPANRKPLDDFLAGLDLATEALIPPTAVVESVEEPTVNPTEAQKGDLLQGGWRVKERLGKGSTAVALLVERGERTEVFKVAHNPEHQDRLRDEYDVLMPLENVGIVRVFGIEEIGGHPALRLEVAGSKTLAARLRTDLPDLSLAQRWGQDLIEIVRYLEDEGVVHRDIKPDNLCVRERRDGSLHLVLFDFSLARAPADQLRVGTPAYLDPFLELRPSKRWDVHAERWSACVVLYEMFVGQRPRWPGGGDPLAMADVEVELDRSLFPDVIADRLVSFFAQAFRRDPRQRFESMDDIQYAWRDVFAGLDVGTTDTLNDSEELRARLASASPDMSLADLGLTPRVIDALSRMQALTVGDLDKVSIPEMRRARGVGERTRREVTKLLQLLPSAERETKPMLGGAQPGGKAVDDVVRVLISADLDPASNEVKVLRALLGLDDAGLVWPSQTDVAQQVGVSTQRVSQILATARQRWKRVAAISAVREDLDELIRTLGGVAEVSELADLLLSLRGSASDVPIERRRAARALLRAALETDRGLSKDRRWTDRQADERVILADDTADFEGDLAAHWADDLGKRADRLLAQASADGSAPEGRTDFRLPSSAVVLESLREVVPPPGLVPPPDSRLVRLAAACSRTAAASPRLDLHPIGMRPEQAIVAARGVLYGSSSLKTEAVHERVQARFPGAAPLPRRPELDELMLRIGLTWTDDGPLPGYQQQGNLGGLSTIGPSRTRLSTGRSPDPQVLIVVDETTRRLTAQAREGGFCVWSVRADRQPAAIAEFEQRLGATVIDIDQLLLKGLHEQARVNEADWRVVLAADARPGEGDWHHLQTFVDRVLDSVRTAVLTTGPIVVLTGLGLLARYDRLNLLDRLRDHATGIRREPGATLRTLWLLLPSDDPEALPTVAGRAVPVVGPNQRAELPTAWLSATPTPVREAVA